MLTPSTLALIEETRKHAQPFYREIWKNAPTDNVPASSIRDLINTPLSQRRYKEEKSLVKIVHVSEGSFLSEWAFADISIESFGTHTKRPFVYMTSAHEAIEKSMWCYGNGMVPLIGEKDPDIAAYSASAYDIDQLITDASALMRLKTYLEKRSSTLTSLTIIDDDFNIASLLPFAPFAETIRLVLARPETGCIAEAPLSENLVFTAAPDCTIETLEDGYVVTKNRALVTPVIRYQFRSTALLLICKTVTP